MTVSLPSPVPVASCDPTGLASGDRVNSKAHVCSASRPPSTVLVTDTSDGIAVLVMSQVISTPSPPSGATKVTVSSTSSRSVVTPEHTIVPET